MIQGDKENQLSYNRSELIGEFSESGPRQDHRWTIVRPAEQEVYNDARALSRDQVSAGARGGGRGEGKENVQWHPRCSRRRVIAEATTSCGELGLISAVSSTPVSRLFVLVRRQTKRQPSISNRSAFRRVLHVRAHRCRTTDREKSDVRVVVIVTRPDRYYSSVSSVSCGEFAGQRDGSRITPITVRWFVSRQVQQVQVRQYPAMQDAVIFESRTLVRLFLGTEVIRSFSRDINGNGGFTTYVAGPATSSCRMLSPGQDTPPSNYSSGNVVLQGAPCSQCRDLCPAGYVPHFWRREGGRKTGHSENNQKKENLRRNTRREAQEEDERRDRKMHHGRRAGQMGKICEEGNKEKRSKRVGSWPCGYDQRNEREKKGEGGN
ncbi:hypothetical protein ALC53_11578 [Atta colombica]|uniref:Uncharacterized protein n=1 Tax=Atta colombica TaxID=520822 RepID=A0A195B1E7_9HYME|nr:hypothetical protein ALC53_11578 [Atta colombica]